MKTFTNISLKLYFKPKESMNNKLEWGNARKSENEIAKIKRSFDMSPNSFQLPFHKRIHTHILYIYIYRYIYIYLYLFSADINNWWARGFLELCSRDVDSVFWTHGAHVSQLIIIKCVSDTCHFLFFSLLFFCPHLCHSLPLAFRFNVSYTFRQKTTKTTYKIEELFNRCYEERKCQRNSIFVP